MEQAQKNQIIRTYLQKRSENKSVEITDEQVSAYPQLSNALDRIEREVPHVLANTAWLEHTLDFASVFIRGNPPKVQSFNENKLTQRIKFWQRDAELGALPGCDYQTRKTSVQEDAELTTWMILLPAPS